MLKIPDSILTLSVSGVSIPKETQKAHEFVQLLWVCDDLITYNLPNSHPALVTLDRNIPVCMWALAPSVPQRNGNYVQNDQE